MKQLSLIRTIEIQLKNGFLKKAPEEFDFMKRYPPISRDDSAGLRKINNKTVPILKYYKEALYRNPQFEGEHVYGDYWRDRPLAVILAQKQFEYVQEGMDEEKAYHKALNYMHEEENKSYVQLKNTVETVKSKFQARKSFTSDVSLSKSINLPSGENLINTYKIQKYLCKNYPNK